MRWILWFMCLCLAGCQLGQGAPPPLPVGDVDGVVTGAQPLAGAPVEILAQGQVIATTRADDQGHFAVQLRIPDTVLTVQTAGVDSVAVGSEQAVISGPLEAELLYHQGVTETIAVSPWSTVFTALAKYFMDRGLPPVQSLEDANQALVAWLGVSPLVVPEAQLTDTKTLSSAVKAALLLRGLSSWAHAEGETTAVATADMVADVGHDGFLNGAGAKGSLHLGGQALSANAYRQGLAGGVLQAAVAAGLLGTTQTALGRAVVSYSKSLATSTSALFGGAPVASFGSSAIAVTLSPLPAWTRGTLMVAGSVHDSLHLPVAVTLMINGQAEQQTTTHGRFDFSVATTDFADGSYVLAVQAVDGAGAHGQAQATVGFDNGGPQACVVSFIGHPTLGTVRGRWSDPAGITQARFDGGAVTVSPNGTWSVFTAPAFLQPMTLTLVDGAGNVRVFVWNLRRGQGGCG